jgi:phosphatidate cytidylyltransferase
LEQRSLGGDDPPQTPPDHEGAACPPVTPRGRTGRNLPVAIGVGAGLGGLVVLTLLTVKATFLLYVGIALALALAELASALARRDINIPVIPVAAGGAAVLTCTYWLGSRPALAALALSVVVILAWRLSPPLASGALWMRSLPSSLASLAPQSRQRSAPPAGSAGGTTGYVKDVTAGVFALAYIPFLASFVAYMLAPADGPRRVLTFVILTIASDIGGYFAGISFGRHKMAPVISPKKTWEGFAGSTLACLAAGALCLDFLLHAHVWQGLLTGAAAVLAATVGDLVESMIKRDLDIKDMGTLLPGHGGVLERLDSLLVCAPVIWLLLYLFVPAR